MRYLLACVLLGAGCLDFDSLLTHRLSPVCRAALGQGSLTIGRSVAADCAGGEDTVLSEATPATAGDNAGEIGTSGKTSAHQVALVEFDLAQLDLTSVRAAELHVYVTNASDAGALQMFRAPWTAASTWAPAAAWEACKAPLEMCGIPIATGVFAAVGSVTVDVTAVVNSWITDPDSNHGFLFTVGAKDSAATLQFVSSEGVDDQRRPSLHLSL